MSVITRDRLAVVYPGIHMMLGNSGLPVHRIDLTAEGVRVELPGDRVFTIPRSTLEFLRDLRAYRGIALLTAYLHRYYVDKWQVKWPSGRGR